jgi:hypothetical protein
MRRNIPFILFLGVLSAISGWLMSRMSWIGRVGVNLFHKEYKFLKVWYKGAGVVFAILLAFFIIQWLLNRRLLTPIARTVHIMALLAAICGLWLTYADFRTDFSHGLLKERFHLGAYLFWIGWMSISLFLLATARSQKRPLQTEIKRP